MKLMRNTIAGRHRHSQAVRATFSVLVLVAVAFSSPRQAAADLASNYSYATAYQNQRQMVRASSGTLALVYQKGSPATKGNGLALVVSRDGGTTWLPSVQVAALPSVFADLFIAANNDIYLTFATNSDGAGAANDVQFAKLHYSDVTDDWTLERRTMVFDALSSTGGFNSVIAAEPGYLWLAFRRYTSSGYSIAVQHSVDDGQTWIFDFEAMPPGPNADETAVFEHFSDKLALVFYHQNTQFRWSWRTIGDPPNAWSPTQLIYQVPRELGSKSDYSIVTDDQQRMHLVFAQQGLKYLQYDGTAWGAVPQLLSAIGADPSLTTNGSDLWVLYQWEVGSSQDLIAMKHFDGTAQAWDAGSVNLSDSDEAFAARAWCVGGSPLTYTDVTVASASTAKKDVKNAITLAMLRSVGDEFYFGAPVPVKYLRVQLATSGAGGAVAWEYWNGFAWTSFTPSSGAYSFEKSASVTLWPEADPAPSDWAACSVGGSDPLYYVRARVTTAYSTAPLGAQISSVRRSQFPSTLHRDQQGLAAVWTRGMSAPFTVVTRLVNSWTAVVASRAPSFGSRAASGCQSHVCTRTRPTRSIPSPRFATTSPARVPSR